ncbi:hypothetical protein QQS21_010494 [Conoideocrella luteorostrata]|uniref:Uncharacterized protein n=1 Tax=Conoideocrella luteorostrata TaxID=1105319 RepID=A0AAJ0CF33_9HYPO|nr:hypothetical protein QQS21_010494 [Conoideocrella luteorostrata]
MRVTTSFIAAGLLVGSTLADITTIRNSLFDVMKKAKDLDKALVTWSGSLTSGGDMLCKTVALRKSFKACTQAFQTSQPLKNSDLTNKNALPLVRLANVMFDLKDHAVEARPKFDRIGATAAMFEIIKAQKEPASEMSNAMAAILEKLPPGFKDSSLPLPAGQVKVLDFARTFMNKELDDLLKKLQPRPEQVSPFTPFVLMAVKFSESIDAVPFCQVAPQLMTFLGSQKSIPLGDLTDKVLKILDASGVQDQVPIDIIRKNAEAIGIPSDTIPKLLDAFGVRAQGLPLRAFTQKAPGLIKQFNLQGLSVDPSRITRFVNLFVESTLGSAARGVALSRIKTLNQGGKVLSRVGRAYG